MQEGAEWCQDLLDPLALTLYNIHKFIILLARTIEATLFGQGGRAP